MFEKGYILTVYVDGMSSTLAHRGGSNINCILHFSPKGK